MENKYQSYFKEHYKNTLTKEDISNYEKWFFTQLRFIRSIVKSEDGKKVLEIGSGFGGFYNLLSETEKKCYKGLELDKEAAEFSAAYFKTATFLNQSLEDFSDPGKFDVIYAFEVLEHFNDPVDSIKKIASLLADDGIFIGTSPYPFRKNILADETHNFVLHPENWKRLFLNHGFREVEVLPMSFFPYIWRINKHLNFRIPFHVPFPSFISTSLIIARK